MPGIVKVRILEGRDLPVMDRSSELTDAYVDVKFHERNIFRTQVCSKTLCPKWNSDWFTFEVDDDQIQEDLLQIKVFDKDTVTANDPIGKVHISLVPLTFPGNHNTISGWFPIFDTLHGIRGEIKLIVKVKYISETKQSSCGVKFFYTKSVPVLYELVEVKSFVEELVIEDDPEYKWIDKIRTTRASNEARQLLFLRLCASLQRKIGCKVLELGGNAVIGYRPSVDLEGSFGVVVRAIGTCVTIKEVESSYTSLSDPLESYLSPETESPQRVLVRQGSAKKTSYMSECSDQGPFFPESTSPTLMFPLAPPKVPCNYTDFPFYTMGTFPLGFVSHIGGLVSSRSVRLLDKLESMPEESDSRDKLWLELRKEVRTHMKTLGCNAVIGYSERSTICDKLCVLSAIGTAVILNSTPTPFDQSAQCSPCHIPYNVLTSPFNITPYSCAVCGNGKVPDILLTTIDTLPNMPVNGNGCFIKVQAFRTKKKQTGEGSAHSIGQQLPFLEYEIHQQLTHKLKIKGMNAVVGIRYELCVGETAILYIASGTAVYLSALPPAAPFRVRCDTDESVQVDKLQEAIQTAYEKNVTCYNITRDNTPVSGAHAPDLDLSFASKDVIVVDIEDAKDEVKIESTLTSPFTDNMYTSSTSSVPGISDDLVPREGAHILTQICRIDTGPSLETSDLNVIINKNMHLMCFKLRKYKTCFLSNIRFHVHMPDEDELVIVISAMATTSLPMCPNNRAGDIKRRYHRFISSVSNEVRFCEEDILNLSNESAESGALVETHVQLTPADHIPGTILRHCYGHLNIFLIRESSDVRDLSSFTKNFIMEAQAILRAHVAALGGNALFEYRVGELVLIDGPQKFQAQILLNISGDAAYVNYTTPRHPST